MKTAVLFLVFAVVFVMFSCAEDREDKTAISEDDLMTFTGYFFAPNDVLNATSRSVIITYEFAPIYGGYTFIAMSCADENLFDDVRSGDKIKMTYQSSIMESSLLQIIVNGYELIERGSIENIIETVPEDIFESWKDKGWILTE